MRSRDDPRRSRTSDPSDLRGRVWRWGSRLSVTVGVMCAVASWGWTTTTAAVLVLAFCTGFIAGGILADRGLSVAPKVVRISLWCGFTLPALAGLVRVFGAAGAAVLLGLVAVSPAVRFCSMNRWFIPGREPEPIAAEPTTPAATFPGRRPETSTHKAALPQDLSAMDDAALCMAWRRSFPILEAARSQAERIAVVMQRQIYLDELQRRCPRGMSAWLASGARASSNPMPFLRDGSPGPTAPY